MVPIFGDILVNTDEPKYGSICRSDSETLGWSTGRYLKAVTLLFSGVHPPGPCAQDGERAVAGVRPDCGKSVLAPQTGKAKCLQGA